MNDYYFYVSKIKSGSFPLTGKFFNDNNGNRYAILRNSHKLQRGSLLIVKEKTEYGESENEERYYITNIEPIHNNQEIKKSKVYLETECEHAERRTQIRHDWKIALFNTLGGALAGLITSIIFWLITQ